MIIILGKTPIEQYPNSNPKFLSWETRNGFVRYRSYEVVGLLEASPEASKMRSLSFARVVLEEE